MAEAPEHHTCEEVLKELEAVLTASGSVREGTTELCHTESLHKVTALLSSVCCSNATLLSTAVDFIGTFHERLSNQPYLIRELFPLVVEGLKHEESATTAVMTLYRFVSKTLDSVRAFLPQILVTAKVVFKTDMLRHATILQLMMCLGHVLSAQPIQEVIEYLDFLLIPSSKLMHQFTELEAGDGVEDRLVLEIERLAALFGCLDTIDPREGEEEMVVDDEEPWPNMVCEVLEWGFPTIEKIIHKGKTRPAIVTAVTRLFTESLTKLEEDSWPVVSRIANLTVEMFTAMPHASILNLRKEMIVKFKTDENTKLFLMVICDHIEQSSDELVKLPHWLETFADFMIVLLSRCRLILFDVDVKMDVLLQFGIRTLKMNKQDNVFKANCLFMKEFLHAAQEEDRLLKAVRSNTLLTVGVSMEKAFQSQEDGRLTTIVRSNMHQLVRTSIEVALSSPGLAVLEMVADLFHECCEYQLASFSCALRDCLFYNLPREQASDRDKLNFMNLLISNYNDKEESRNALLEFVLKCSATTSHPPP